MRGNHWRTQHLVLDVGSIPACAGEPKPVLSWLGKSKVYPRVCGGTSWRRRRKRTASGLSPRVRGNPVRPWSILCPFGSIPACAGEPSRLSFRCVDFLVYPRVCGGTQDCDYDHLGLDGLSPRVRGNRCDVFPTLTSIRSIPACAGEPDRSPPYLAKQRVYPRVCGGTLRSNLYEKAIKGLSPRVRGNHSQDGHRHGGARSIPACAGEPAGDRWKLRATRVYPRVCGGTGETGLAQGADHGLSPRVRGNLGTIVPDAVPRRSIPACAGEPLLIRMGVIGMAVYPRVCGGTVGLIGDVPDHVGLSPRVRGNHSQDGHRHGGARSIPACAGEPAGDRWKLRATRVYPRVCGGTGETGLAQGADHGLSPRVRGNLGTIVPDAVPRRSIPACAGEPLLIRMGVIGMAVYPRVCGGTVGLIGDVPDHVGLSPRVRGNLRTSQASLM